MVWWNILGAEFIYLLNSTYLLTSVVPFKVVLMGLYTVHSKPRDCSTEACHELYCLKLLPHCPVNPYRITCDYLQKEFCSHPVGSHVVAIWCLFRLSFRMLWIDPNEISSRLAISWVLTSVLEKQFLHFSHHVLCFAHQWMPWVGFFNKGYTTNVENHSKLVFFTMCTLQQLLSTFRKFV